MKLSWNLLCHILLSELVKTKVVIPLVKRRIGSVRFSLKDNGNYQVGFDARSNILWVKNRSIDTFGVNNFFKDVHDFSS